MDGMDETPGGDALRTRGGESAVRVEAASYVRGGYRSFEFADASARAGALTALLSGERVHARDLLLAVVGMVRPTSGSLAVGGASFTAPAGGGRLRAALAWGAFRRMLRAGGLVGVGVFTGLTDLEEALTVEEAVSREMARRRRSGDTASDPLDFLAQLGLATHADRRVGLIPPAARARLSAAVALAAAPRAAVIDLRDPFCAGLTAAEELAAVRALRGVARSTGAAIMVSCAEARSAAAADAAFALDIAASEALRGLPVEMPGLLSAARGCGRPVSEGVDA